MALVRCAECGRPLGRTRKYIRSVPPVGHPEGGLVCGKSECERPGLIWLDRQEGEAYDQGKRIFSLPAGVGKVRVG